MPLLLNNLFLAIPMLINQKPVQKEEYIGEKCVFSATQWVKLKFHCLRRKLRPISSGSLQIIIVLTLINFYK